MTRSTFPIGELSQQSGCKVSTIRYYEATGLLPASPRTNGGHRVYDSNALKRIVFIRRSRELGFTLEEIAGLLDLSADDDRACAEVDAIANKHLDEIEAKLADLLAMRDALRDLIERCQGTTITECRIIEALSPDVGDVRPRSQRKTTSGTRRRRRSAVDAP